MSYFSLQVRVIEDRSGSSSAVIGVVVVLVIVVVVGGVVAAIVLAVVIKKQRDKDLRLARVLDVFTARCTSLLMPDLTVHFQK